MTLCQQDTLLAIVSARQTLSMLHGMIRQPWQPSMPESLKSQVRSTATAVQLMAAICRHTTLYHT